MALHVLPSHRGLDRRAPAWHTVHYHIALSVRPPFGRPCPHNMSCSHILGGIILRPYSSPNRFSHTVSSVVTGTSFPDSDAAPIGQQPVAFRVFSVCNEDCGSQRKWRFERGVLYRENKSDQASYRLRFPCLSAPCDGILGGTQRTQWLKFSHGMERLFLLCPSSYYYISTVETGFSQIPPGSCYIDEIAHTFTLREGM